MSRFASMCLVVMTLVAGACSDGSNSTVSAADSTGPVDGITAGVDEDDSQGTDRSSAEPAKVVADGAGEVASAQDETLRSEPSRPGVGTAGQQPAGPVIVAAGETPDLGRPDDVVAEIQKTLDAKPVSGAAVLDAIGPLDDEATSAEVRDTRDLRAGKGDPSGATPRNETGELVQLDETAALACADVERALTAVDEGELDDAIDHIESAASRAGESHVEGIAAWSQPLEEASTSPGDDLAVLLGFLSSCTKGGYEL